MKSLYNRLSFAIDFFLRKSIKNIIIVGVLTWCLVTLLSGVYLDKSVIRYKERIGEIINIPVENISIISDDSMSPEVYSALSEEENFIGAGGVDLFKGSYPERWIGFDEELQKKRRGEINIINADYDILQFSKPELSDGKYYTQKEAESLFGDKLGVYIGADYKGAIPVGTVFKPNTEQGYELVVLGHFKRGAVILSSEVLMQVFHEKNVTEENLDNKILFVDSNAHGVSNSYYFLASKCSADDFRESIRTKIDPDIQIVTMNEAIQYREKANEDLYKLYNRLFALILIVSVCMIFCFEMISISENNRTYGILLTNGYKQKDIIDIMIIENIIKYLLAFSLAFFITYYRYYKKYKEMRGGGDIKAFQKDFVFYTVPGCFMVGLAVVLAALIIPAIRLRRRPVSEYLRDR